jgi:hypothetical protein
MVISAGFRFRIWGNILNFIKTVTLQYEKNPVIMDSNHFFSCSKDSITPFDKYFTCQRNSPDMTRRITLFFTGFINMIPIKTWPGYFSDRMIRPEGPLILIPVRTILM